MPELTPAERSLLARAAVLSSWAKTTDRSAHGRGGDTATRSRANLLAFERQVDPDGDLDPAERERRARAARLAHMNRMSYLASRARHARLEQAS
jgi:hypothetical protein